MKPKLIVFDLDGTILDTLQDLFLSVNYMLLREGHPARTVDEVRAFVGNGIHKLMSRALPAGATDRELARALACFSEYYEAHSAENTRPYDGIPELLSELKQRGILLAVVSNKNDSAVKPLCEIYFPGVFDLAVGASEEVPKKPAPDAVLKVLKDLRVDISEAVYVGDSEVDIETAKNAGMPCISVDWGFRDEDVLRRCGASRIIHDAPALLEALLGLC